MIHKIEKPNAQDDPVANILCERRFGADRLGFTIRHNRPIIDAIRKSPNVSAHFAEAVAQRLFSHGSYLADGANAHIVKALFPLPNSA